MWFHQSLYCSPANSRPRMLQNTSLRRKDDCLGRMSWIKLCRRAFQKYSKVQMQQTSPRCLASAAAACSAGQRSSRSVKITWKIYEHIQRQMMTKSPKTNNISKLQWNASLAELNNSWKMSFIMAFLHCSSCQSPFTTHPHSQDQPSDISSSPKRKPEREVAI